MIVAGSRSGSSTFSSVGVAAETAPFSQVSSGGTVAVESM